MKIWWIDNFWYAFLFHHGFSDKVASWPSDFAVEMSWVWGSLGVWRKDPRYEIYSNLPFYLTYLTIFCILLNNSSKLFFYPNPFWPSNLLADLMVWCCLHMVAWPGLSIRLAMRTAGLGHHRERPDNLDVCKCCFLVPLSRWWAELPLSWPPCLIPKWNRQEVPPYRFILAFFT